MNGPLKLLRIVQWKQLKGVSGLFFRHPLLFISALPATWQCIEICDKLFGKAHHKHNKANAFRHALWNMMLIKFALRSGSSLKNAKIWAKKITDWHEDFSPNSREARAMDLHNNHAGRALYEINFGKKQVKNTQITQALLPLLNQAVIFKTTEDLKSIDHFQLVYLKP